MASTRKDRPLLALAATLIAAPVASAPRAGTPRKAAPATVARLEVSPPALSLHGRGETDRLYVTAVLAGGAVRDVTAQAVYALRGGVVRLEGPGVRAVKDGRAEVMVSYGARTAVVPVTVTGTAAERRLSFRYDVMPVLTKSGCNQGACHGNAEGRGGLKLSLRGEDPENDYDILTRHGGGRRISRSDPGASLLLLKATSAVPHGGGRRFEERSDEYRTVARWLAQGAGIDPGTAPRLVRLEVRPRERVIVAPARSQRLTVLGAFSDGSVRNLSRSVYYSPGDPSVEVSADGLATAGAGVDTAVLVRYADRMASARLTFIPARPAFAWKAVPAANWIDDLNFRRLEALRLQPSGLSTDPEFLRRAYLDTLGVLPTPEEVRTFLADRRPDRRARLVDALLERPEFDEYWTMKWGDMLRLEERSLDPKGSQAYRDWIRASMAQRKPLDQFARELLTATGSTYTNPPANYYRRTRSAIDLSESTAQVFMGVRMGCAKCHNHPFERWTQDDYYALAAFFSRVGRKIENLTRRDRFDLHELNGEEFISVAAKGDVEHPRSRRPVPPRLPLSTVSVAAQLGGEPADRRAVFAEWLTRPDNPFFARAMANRIWYHLIGRGVVDPVDDLRDSNPPSNPELLDALARELATHRFDLRHLVRTIMNSRTYQLSATPNATNSEDERFFSRAIVQRLPAEVLLDAISQATGVPEEFPGVPTGTRAVQLIHKKLRHPFLKLFGQPPHETVCECERTNEPTLGQSFALISTGIVNEKVQRKENRIGRLLEAGKPDREIVTELYLATVSRDPSSPEMTGALGYLRSKPDRRAALEDLFWALLNSKEFLLRR